VPTFGAIIVASATKSGPKGCQKGPILGHFGVCCLVAHAAVSTCRVTGGEIHRFGVILGAQIDVKMTSFLVVKLTSFLGSFWVVKMTSFWSHFRPFGKSPIWGVFGTAQIPEKARQNDEIP